MSDLIIETKELRKVFASREKGKAKTVEAVAGIDLDVSKGEIFGLLGPNGAGKTTAMRMLCTLLIPTSGSATIAGFDLRADQDSIRRSIGYVGQKGGMEPIGTGRENLVLQAQLYGMGKKEAQARADELMARLQIESFGNRRTSTYSGGQRRIFDIAAGVIHQPTLLFMDEPTTGLDPQSRARVWEEVKRLHEAGTTIFLTTHYLEEADILCDRVAIVDRGKIVSLGTPASLKGQISGDVVSLEFENESIVAQAKQALARDPSIKEFQPKEEMLHLYVEHGDENLPGIMKALNQKNIIIKTVALSRPSLDDVFLKLTGRSMRETEE